MANMSDHVEQAQAIVDQLSPEVNRVRLHTRKCSRLRERLGDVVILAGRCTRGEREQYGGLFEELYSVALKVRRFVKDCCYETDNDFVIAAIRVTAHKERFVQYHVELDWCSFLFSNVLGARSGSRSVSSNTLRQFEWNLKIISVLSDTSRLAGDERELKALLQLWMGEPGQHQAICWALLRRFRDTAATPELALVPYDLGIPPFTHTLEEHDVIGRGAFGTVYRINWQEQLFAVKVFDIGGDADTINTEVRILQDCCHPHIVNLILAHKKDGKQYLLMEKLAMNLDAYIKERFPFTPRVAVDMILQVCEGMLYLSSMKNVSHRDVKPLNILVKEDPESPTVELQVGDFGLAKVRCEKELDNSSKSENTPNVGTTTYRAPEMTEPGAENKIHAESLKADIYSFALTCSCILTGTKPFRNKPLSEIPGLVKAGRRPQLPEDCPPELSSLLQRCWRQEPSERPASFCAIRDELRNLRATLLLRPDADRYRPSDPLPESLPQPPKNEVTFQPGDRPLRILVLGKSELVKIAVNHFCGAAAARPTVQDHVRLTESRSASPPMCLTYSDAHHGNEFRYIRAFVKARNSRWHHDQVEEPWMDDLRNVPLSPAGHPLALFPHHTLRLHTVLFVCRTFQDLPDDLTWKNQITKGLCGLPVQILVIGTHGSHALDNELNQILVRNGSHLFPNCEKLEDLIVKVDLRAHDMKEKLCSAIREVKTRAEIENVAMTIARIRKKLGSEGIVVSVGVSGNRVKAFSLSRSGEFILQFLCTYWEIPQNFILAILHRMNTFVDGSNKIRIHPKEFVIFCLRVAAVILYSARNSNHAYRLEVPAQELLEEEAEACCKSYFGSDITSCCDRMTFEDIRDFLQSVSQREPARCIGASVDRNSGASKFLATWLRCVFKFKITSVP